MQKPRLRTLLICFVGAGATLAVVWSSLLRVREAARQTTCQANIRQIALAMLNYESAHRHLPVGIETTPLGTPYRSWRTHLYPAFIQSSHQHYDPDFAWDSSANAGLYDGTPVTATDKGGLNPRQVVLDPCPPYIWCCPVRLKKTNELLGCGWRSNRISTQSFPLNLRK